MCFVGAWPPIPLGDKVVGGGTGIFQRRVLASFLERNFLCPCFYFLPPGPALAWRVGRKPLRLIRGGKQ